MPHANPVPIRQPDIPHPNTGEAHAAIDPTTRLAPPPLDRDWALFLDVDGCLLDFGTTPDGVVVTAGLREQLATWAERLDGALALVSGRSLAQLDRLFAPLRLPAAGLHGLERRHGKHRSDPLAIPTELIAIYAQALRLADAWPGIFIEDKGAALALHWRRAPDAGQTLTAFASAALPRLPGYRLQRGDHVVELRPAAADKGSAIAAFLDEAPFAGRVPVFAGDDLTDESGFAVVNTHGGLSVLVGGRGHSAATHALPDPAAVRAWIAA
jgi:trehalose 6-phosphate phosphatase